MSVEESNKALVKRYIEETWNKGNTAIIDEVIAPDFIQHVPGVLQGGAGIKGFFAMLHGAFSNISNTIEDVIAEGDKVVWRSTIRATHTGTFRGLPATGKTVTFSAMNLVRLQDGKIVENWGEQDNLSMLQQLGLIPRPS